MCAVNCTQFDLIFVKDNFKKSILVYLGWVRNLNEIHETMIITRG